MTQEDVELAYQEAMMNMARLNRTGKEMGGQFISVSDQEKNRD